MRVVFVISIVALLVTLVAVVIAALSRHKKAGSKEIRLLGEIGRVNSRLDPEGTVLLSGELWRARSNNGATILSRARIRVTGFQDHIVLVKGCD